MGEVRVVGIRVEQPQNQPVLLLRESDGDRYLPIWIGQSEAAAIALACFLASASKVRSSSVRASGFSDTKRPPARLSISARPARNVAWLSAV